MKETGRPRKLKDARVFIFYLSNDLLEQLKEVAYRKKISVGEFIRQALTEKLRKESNC